MSEDTKVVLVAGYQDLAVAHHDFDGLAGQVKAKQVTLDGAILVAKDADGNARLEDTGDHLGRKGAAWGAGVGAAVGLFAPPMLGAAAAVGAGAGALVGKFADHRLKSGLEEKIGQALSAGTAVVVAVLPETSRLAVERVLAGSAMKSAAEMDGSGMGELKSSLAEAMGKFNPDRTTLPIPNPNFGGTIGRTLDSSASDWSIIMSPKPPEGAPNVLLVLIDDAGFGNPSTFGGPVSTPNLTRVQQMGLTYNRFHVTALCSPTRAATLTGRNHHRVGFGSIGEFPGPYPGYTAARPKDCAPVVRMLQGNGYVTGGFGKWHLTPDHVQGMAGPFDLWPNAWGFDHWWGFLGGASTQFDPLLSQDNSIIGVPEGGKGEQYYLPDDLTDQAVKWVHEVKAQDPDKPWFMYYSTGCSHAPHHVTRKWSDKYKGMFDDGWEAYREKTFQRQKELGVIPADAVLTPRPDLFPAWDSLSDDEKRLYARQMEVYAGYQENADWNVGRLLDAVEEMDDLDNTLIFYIWGDNGASMEGTITGSFNELTFLNGVAVDATKTIALVNEEYGGLQAWGGRETLPHYAAAWGWAGNAPFQWGKQMASHLGGCRDGMVVAWPSRISDVGSMRTQFTHCIDIGPTILEAAGIPEATSVDGIAQQPMDGTSFLYTFDDPDAAEQHTVQYFEIYGSRAIYQDGWWACAKLDKAPWDLSPETMARLAPGAYDPERDAWELYYLPEDFTQAENLAEAHPDKLAELKELFWAEAERNQVLPLLGGLSVFFGDLPPMPTVARQTYYGDVQNISAGMIPRIYGRSYAIEADLHVPDGGCEGVIVAEADELGGFALWVDESGLLHHTYSMLGVERYAQVSSEPIPAGDVSVTMLFEADQSKPGTGGKVTLLLNDTTIGEGRIDRTVPIRFSDSAGLDIGCDNGMYVDRAYADKSPYPFSGTVKKVVFDLKPVTHDAAKQLHAHTQRHGVVKGIDG